MFLVHSCNQDWGSWWYRSVGLVREVSAETRFWNFQTEADPGPSSWKMTRFLALQLNEGPLQTRFSEIQGTLIVRLSLSLFSSPYFQSCDLLSASLNNATCHLKPGNTQRVLESYLGFQTPFILFFSLDYQGPSTLFSRTL